MTDKHRKPDRGRPKLEVVLKCDSVGSVEAVAAAVSEIMVPDVDVSIIHSGVGAVSKSDVFLAETASRLVVGFQVDALQGIDRVLREHRVEVRLYNVIYALTADVKAIAESIIPAEAQEQITGSARVIALFKSSRKGAILGCEVQEGFLAIGHHFRIISAMGPVYSGVIESLHIGENAVQKATAGQQVGVKVKDFRSAKIGDIVESFRSLPQRAHPWQATGQIIRK